MPCLFCETELHDTKKCPKLAEAGIDPNDYLHEIVGNENTEEDPPNIAESELQQ